MVRKKKEIYKPELIIKSMKYSNDSLTVGFEAGRLTVAAPCLVNRLDKEDVTGAALQAVNRVVVLLNVWDDHPAVRRVIQTWQNTHRKHVWAKHLAQNWNKPFQSPDPTPPGWVAAARDHTVSVRSCWSIPLPRPQVYRGALPSPLRRWDAFTKPNLFPIKEKKKKLFAQSDERTPEGWKRATAFKGGNDVWKVG